MKPSHKAILDALEAGGSITCGSMVETARLYSPGRRVRRVRQMTLINMFLAGLLTRPIEMHDGWHIGGWLEFFPTFAVDDTEEQWDRWAP
jgi:hypothetical protein